MGLTDTVKQELFEAFFSIDDAHFVKDIENRTYELFFTKKLKKVQDRIIVEIYNFLSKRIPIMGVHEVNKEALEKIRTNNIRRQPQWI